MRYVVGSPASGPFNMPKEYPDENTARYWTEDQYGPVLDVMDWPGEDGEQLVLLVVADE